MSWHLPSLLPPLLRRPWPAKVGSASDQIRGVKNRPLLIACTFSSQRHADLGVSSCSLLNHAHVGIVSYFLFFCLHLLCHFRFAPFAPRDNSFRFQAHTQHPLAFRFISNGQTYIVLNAYSSFSRASFRNKSPSSQSVVLCLFFVTWTQRCMCGSSIGGSLFLISSWLL